MRSHPSVVTRPEALSRRAVWPGPQDEALLAADRHAEGDRADGPPALPVPGRHASRRAAERPVARIAEVLPAPLRGRVALGLPQLGVVVVLVALGLVVTGWWLVRSEARSVEVAPPSLEQSSGPDLVALSPAATPAQPGAVGAVADTGGAPPTSPVPPAASGTTGVTVDVAGRVRRPGIAVLPSGSRVVDALEAVGGAREGVDLTTLNLARPLVDGEQILVGDPPAPAPVPAALDGAASSTALPTLPTALVDLNEADQASLETLPEVGPVTALAILAWREEHGSFTAVEELLEVSGIGDATLAMIAPHVTV